MSVEACPTVIGIHVEGIFRQSWEIRAQELASEGEDEPIIGKG